VTYDKPLPHIDPQSRPFWDAARAHELRLPKCDDCGLLRTQFERWCPKCGGQSSTWVKLSGRGKVWSHCTFHRSYFAQFAAELPYQVVLIELEEGPKLISNIVGASPILVAVGLSVAAVFEDVTSEVTLVKFTPMST
jgi:uncharacterized OB-fold protein